MVKTLYDPRVKQEGIREGIRRGIKEGIKEGELKVAKRLLSLGVDVNTVIKATEFTKDEINQLQDQS